MSASFSTKSGATLISTTPKKAWQTRSLKLCTASKKDKLETLTLTGTRFQTWRGWGCCFNELGYEALKTLPEAARRSILKELFHPTEGCHFSYNRVPIGASDYAASWYSLNETPGDFAMKHFSIRRDEGCLIPYIQEAMKFQPGMTLFASPWSPPTWMKFPAVYNYGKLIWEKKNLEAYARYFSKFIRAYRAKGIPVTSVHPQNEPVSNQKFPSCCWTGAEMRDFIRDYLGPHFRREKLDTEIWLGTINSDDHNEYALTVLGDAAARKFISGIGYQWAGKIATQRTHAAFPDVPMIQSENECGNGKNTREYARYVFGLIWTYLNNGAQAYLYWNTVLKPEGESAWGWKQNSMVTVDPTTKKVTFNPEFYLMKHCASAILPGSVRCGVEGTLAGNAIAFERPDKALVLVLNNPLETPRSIQVCTERGSVDLILDGDSYHTLMIR